MQTFFKEKYEDRLDLKNTEFEPLIDLFSDMLAVDVYLFTGLIKTKIIPSEMTTDFLEIEKELLSQELEKNPRRKSKRNKFDEKLLIDHFNELLDTPIKGGYIEKIWEVLDTIDTTLGDVAVLFALIRANILSNLDGAVNITSALGKVMAEDLQRREVNKKLLS